MVKYPVEGGYHMGFRENIREAEERRERVTEYCTGCLKFNPKTLACLAFKEPYPLWGQGECWARVESPKEMQKVLDQMVEYGVTDPKIQILRKRISTISDEEIREVYYEEVHKPLLKPPRGERQDRTHKLFPASRMRDNRYKPPWEGF